MDPTFALALVAGGVTYAVWRYRNRDQAGVEPEALPEGLREVDLVPVRCQHLDHHPDHVPTRWIHNRNAGLDVRDLQKTGWGSNSRITVCRYHNTTDDDLFEVHVECGRGCGTHETVDVDDADVGIGRLRYRGWRNDGMLLVCPYCAGTRSRHWR